MVRPVDPPTAQVMHRHSSPEEGRSSASSTRKQQQEQQENNLAEFAKYIPLRLSEQERSLLTVLEQTLHVSEYTDFVDSTSSRRGVKARRILDGILEACHIATGLAVASGHERELLDSCSTTTSTSGLASSTTTDGDDDDGEANQESSGFSLRRKKNTKQARNSSNQGTSTSSSDSSSSWACNEPKENALLFQTMFEIGRRNKVLNPSSMRTTYGKLMYMLQDAQNPTVAKSLGFSLHKDLVLVAPFLRDRGGARLLHDERLVGATPFIRDRDVQTGERLDRSIVDEKVKEKQQLMKELVQEYTTEALPKADVERVINSISDAIAYVESNVAPVQRMLSYLEENFTPKAPRGGFSLELRGSSRMPSFSSYSYGFSAYGSSGSEGPTLSHSHSTQYTFVWQSLRLWTKVLRNMHQLWTCADDGMFSFEKLLFCFAQSSVTQLLDMHSMYV